jgi:hypothetical protein
LVRLENGARALAAAKCGTSLRVVGIVQSGAVVLGPGTTDTCQSRYRWRVDEDGMLRPLPSGQNVSALYSGNIQ